MYLRQCKHCKFLFRSPNKGTVCEDCKQKNFELRKVQLSKKRKGYKYQDQLRRIAVAMKDVDKKFI